MRTNENNGDMEGIRRFRREVAVIEKQKTMLTAPVNDNVSVGANKNTTAVSMRSKAKNLSLQALNETNGDEQRQATTAMTTTSPFSFFYSMLPKDILGVSVEEIRKDLVDGHTQIRSL